MPLLEEASKNNCNKTFHAPWSWKPHVHSREQKHVYPPSLQPQRLKPKGCYSRIAKASVRRATHSPLHKPSSYCTLQRPRLVAAWAGTWEGWDRVNRSGLTYWQQGGVCMKPLISNKVSAAELVVCSRAKCEPPAVLGVTQQLSTGQHALFAHPVQKEETLLLSYTRCIWILQVLPAWLQSSIIYYQHTTLNFWQALQNMNMEKQHARSKGKKLSWFAITKSNQACREI